MEATEGTVPKRTWFRAEQSAKALDGASLSLLIRFGMTSTGRRRLLLLVMRQQHKYIGKRPTTLDHQGGWPFAIVR